jgi:NADPH:quinone reductase-like Zn-dependent oxidoreductase
LSGQYGLRKPQDRVPLSDGVGSIDALGDGVTGWTLGQRVTAAHFVGWLDGAWSPQNLGQDMGMSRDGWLAEHTIVPAESLIAVPDGLTDAQVAALPSAGTTVWHALVGFGHLRAGECVLALGTGGVSVLGLQIARALGARVAITSSSDDKLERMRALGAAATVNYATRPDWGAAVREATGGADVVVETGGIGTLAQSIDAAAVNGRLALIGALDQGGSLSSLMGVVLKNLTLRGLTSGTREMLAQLLQTVERHRIVPVVDRVFDFDDAPAAYAHLQSGRHIGKVLVRVSD